MPQNQKGSIILILACGIPILLMGAGVALVSPVPRSDFLYFWEAAHNLAGYHKGGGIVLPYSLLARIGLEAKWSALLLNSLSWIVVCLSVLHEGRGLRRTTEWPHFVFLGVLTPWWVTMAGLVSSDLPAAALVFLGARFLWQGMISGSLGLFIFAGLIGGWAASMRLQYLPIFFGVAFFALLGSIFLLKSIKIKKGVLLLTPLLLVVVLVEMPLRRQSLAQDELRLHSRITFYTGVLSSDSKFPDCGGWNAEAVRLVEVDKALSMSEIVRERLGRRGWSELSALWLCKARRLGDLYFGSVWVGISRPDQVPWFGKAFLAGFSFLERVSGMLMGLWLFMSAIFFSYSGLVHRNYRLLFPSLFLLNYVLIHVFVLELQGRYILPIVATTGFLNFILLMDWLRLNRKFGNYP
jgi:hypothetical protein